MNPPLIQTPLPTGNHTLARRASFLIQASSWALIPSIISAQYGHPVRRLDWRNAETRVLMGSSRSSLLRNRCPAPRSKQVEHFGLLSGMRSDTSCHTALRASPSIFRDASQFSANDVCTKRELRTFLRESNEICDGYELPRRVSLTLYIFSPDIVTEGENAVVDHQILIVRSK